MFASRLAYQRVVQEGRSLLFIVTCSCFHHKAVYYPLNIDCLRTHIFSRVVLDLSLYILTIFHLSRCIVAPGFAHLHLIDAESSYRVQSSDPRRSMLSMPSSYRETDPTSSSDEHRYLPSDFHTLTNRREPSPHFTPGSALEPPAEYSNDGRTVVTADKRAIARSPVSNSVRIAQGSRHYEGIRKSSWSSVKEEDGGKLPQDFRSPILLRTPYLNTPY